MYSSRCIIVNFERDMPHILNKESLAKERKIAVRLISFENFHMEPFHEFEIAGRSRKDVKIFYTVQKLQFSFKNDFERQ